MVNSNVNPSVEYKETTDIEPDDLKYESFPYNIIFDTIDTINPIQVIFGQLKTTYENDGVSYWYANVTSKIALRSSCMESTTMATPPPLGLSKC